MPPETPVRLEVPTPDALPQPAPWDRLKQFARPKAVTEHCELCGAGLATEHAHLLELNNRHLLCACAACSILFDRSDNPRYRRVPRRVQLLATFNMPDLAWEELHIPINLAFFFHHSTAGRITAFYPGPAGATESLLDLAAWEGLAAANPVLTELQPDVEALLVNRIGERRDYYRVSIDECFKLVGLIRMHWRGLSGGRDAWNQIDRFFADLKRRSQPLVPLGEERHA